MSSLSHSKFSVPEGHVALVLLKEENSSRSFYLEIPLEVIKSSCLKPRKYLVFLGWCIFGDEGVLALEYGGGGVDTEGDLDDQGIYYFVLAGLNLAHAVDLEVIKVRTNLPSESTQTDEEFRTNLLERDVRCVWTGVEETLGGGLHIIPYERGSEWLRLIVENRPKYGEDVTELRDIDDIRNGVFANVLIRRGFDQRVAVILKSPNHILETGDIPSRHERTRRLMDVGYPPSSRYTLQWLYSGESRKSVTSMVPNNIDAAFRKNTEKPKPSDLLLHYNYGAAAIKCWGRGTEVLENRANPPRPSVQPTKPSRTTAIGELEEARNPDGAGAGTGALVESEGQATWDEDDVMMFFWENSQAAKERHLKEVSENTLRMEQWRSGVAENTPSGANHS